MTRCCQLQYAPPPVRVYGELIFVYSLLCVLMFCAYARAHNHSGDNGVGGAWEEPCKQGHYVASFPASSPWVTAVGGTLLQQQKVRVSDCYRYKERKMVGKKRWVQARTHTPTNTLTHPCARVSLTLASVGQSWLRNLVREVSATSSSGPAIRCIGCPSMQSPPLNVKMNIWG